MDQTFGAGGKVLTNFSGNDYSYGFAGLRDGKLMVSGTDHDGIFVARYLPSGRLDDSFGYGGFVTFYDSSGEAGGMAVQPDGKIVIAYYYYDESIKANQLRLIRLWGEYQDPVKP